MFGILSTFVHYVFYQPIFNLLMLIYDLTGGNLALAIVLIAGIAKLITIPITSKQMKSAGKMKVFQQKSQKVREKY